jgi:hypothetical protein
MFFINKIKIDTLSLLGIIFIILKITGYIN